MKYPTELSTEAQASVEHERILAEEEFDTARAGLRSNFEKALAQLIRRYVIRVVLAFAKEACKLGRNRVWPASQVESKVHSFMEQVARKANAEKRFYSNGEYLEGFSLPDSYRPGSIAALEMHRLSMFPEWKEYYLRASKDFGIIVQDHRLPHQDVRLRAFYRSLLTTGTRWTLFPNILEGVFLTPSDYSTGLHLHVTLLQALGRQF